MASTRSLVLGFSSLNDRLVSMLVAGHAPTVDALLAMGSSPYEGLVTEPDESGKTVRRSLLGWALSTDLDDEQGTPTLNRLRDAAVARVVDRRTANQAVTRWSQGEWCNTALLDKGQQGLLTWSMNAQTQVLSVALPWVEDALRQQVGLATSMRHDQVQQDILQTLVRKQLLNDLLLHHGGKTASVAFTTAKALLPPDAWHTMMIDPTAAQGIDQAGAQTPHWPDLPWPWMAAVCQRWPVLGPWLQAQPTEVWLAPLPYALKTSSAPPLIDHEPDRPMPVRHLLDLARAALLGYTPARHDQQNAPVLTHLIHTACERWAHDEAMRNAWSLNDLYRLHHWVRAHRDEVRDTVHVEAWLATLERGLLRHTADASDAVPCPRRRPRL